MPRTKKEKNTGEEGNEGKTKKVDFLKHVCSLIESFHFCWRKKRGEKTV